jgi:hypothetical protein
MKIDLAKVQSSLFEKTAVRERIKLDFAIASTPVDAVDFARLLVDTLKQSVAAQPLEQTITSAKLFQAAVWALGSNSRDWCVFRRYEERLRILLEDYVPQSAVRSLVRRPRILNEIKFCLKGVTSGRDADAIVRWAHILAEKEDFYKEIVRVGQKFREDYNVFNAEVIDDFDLALCMIGHFADARCSGQLKFPGMGYALASEFFKNLGWSVFKPDRHIQRLFDRWFAHHTATLLDHRKLDTFQSLILGRKKSAELRTFLKYSMIGKTASPVGSTFSQVDNTVWLLGKYVEKKGKETSAVYVVM